jgi:hypothetical protein
VSRRTYFNDQVATSQGLVHCEFSFLTNNTSDPATTAFRGCGGLTGSAGATSVSNSGPSAVASITRTGVGAYLITLADGYRFVQAYDASIDDGADTLQPRIGTISNEGAGHTTAITLALTVRAMATGTATESTGRRISVFLSLKNAGNGS